MHCIGLNWFIRGLLITYPLLKIISSQMQNIKPLEAYLYINVAVSMIFMLINPLYALVVTTLISLLTGRVSNWLVGVLFVISFATMYSNQVFVQESDLGSYIHMYLSAEMDTYSGIFNTYVNNINSHEFLWFYYCKILGTMSGYSKEIFILTTYTMIFSLSAYFAYLASENGRYNFTLLLFGLVFLELVLFSNIFNMWKTIAASLVFIISLLIGDSKQSKYVSRIIMYSSMFIHTAMILLVIAYELYCILMRKKPFELNGGIFYVKLIFITIAAIIALSFIGQFIGYLSYFGDTFLAGYERYSGQNITREFSMKDYLSPLYILLGGYIIFNYKYIKNYEAFIISSFIVLTAMPYIANDMAMIYSRANVVPRIMIIIMSVKFLKNIPSIYSIFFVMIIFIARMLSYASNELNLPLEMIAKGDFFNVNYGLFASILYFYDPRFLVLTSEPSLF
jgi:hypothetical protein